MTEQASDIVSTTAARAQTLISWFVEKGPEHVVGVGVIVGLFVGLRILRSILSGTFQTKKQDVGSFRNLVGSVIGATTSIFLLIASAALVVP
ncbi:MAG: hypothetical protein AAFR20_10050, partial [Pseudomonadota bacterium]